MRLLPGIGALGRQRGNNKTGIYADHVTQAGDLHVLESTPNQDACFNMLRPKYGGSPRQVNVGSEWGNVSGDVFAIGVFDGHGEQGHHASSMASHLMQESLDRLLVSTGNMELAQVAEKAFAEVASEISNADFATDSGTTATVVLVRERDMVIAHVGDSSAMLVSQSPKMKRLVPSYVTDMHRPGLKTEAQRIEKAGGIIAEGYIIDQVTQNKGIAVTRTLGDKDMVRNGCIAEPEIKMLRLTKRDRAVVIASDGFWDIPKISSKDVTSAVAKSGGDAQSLSQELMKTVKALRGPSDDCTIACMTFGK